MVTPVKAIPRVVDVYHGDVFNHDVKKSLSLVEDFKAMASVGIWGIIHKATQGIGNTDHSYHERMNAARQAGLLTGAYHFNTGDTTSGQVNHFFDAAQPDAETLMCLDWEDNRQSQMNLRQAIEFLTLADEKLGRPLWVYSGNRAKEQVVNESAEAKAVFAKRHLWLCRYAPGPGPLVDANGHDMPFKDAPLWQYTGDGLGQLPHTLPGIVTKGIDINHYAGTRDELHSAWIS